MARKPAIQTETAEPAVPQIPAEAAAGDVPAATKLDEAGGVPDLTGTALQEMGVSVLPETAATTDLAFDQAQGSMWLSEPTVVVQGPAKGRWRIGRKFGPEPTSIPVTEMTEAQFEALTADPELLVTIVDAPH